MFFNAIGEEIKKVKGHLDEVLPTRAKTKTPGGSEPQKD
jgi:hypothetical protein